MLIMSINQTAIQTAALPEGALTAAMVGNSSGSGFGARVRRKRRWRTRSTAEHDPTDQLGWLGRPRKRRDGWARFRRWRKADPRTKSRRRGHGGRRTHPIRETRIVIESGHPHLWKSQELHGGLRHADMRAPASIDASTYAPAKHPERHPGSIRELDVIRRVLNTRCGDMVIEAAPVIPREQKYGFVPATSPHHCIDDLPDGFHPRWMSAGGCSSFGVSCHMRHNGGSVPALASVANWVAERTTFADPLSWV